MDILIRFNKLSVEKKKPFPCYMSPKNSAVRIYSIIRGGKEVYIEEDFDEPEEEENEKTNL